MKNLNRTQQRLYSLFHTINLVNYPCAERVESDDSRLGPPVVVLRQWLVSISFKCVTRCASVIVDWVNVWIQPSGACVRFLCHWFGSVNP